MLLPEILTLYYAYVIIRFLGYAHVFTRTYFSSINIAKLVPVYTRFSLAFSSGLHRPLVIFCKGNVISAGMKLKILENGTTICHSYFSFGYIHIIQVIVIYF